MVKTKMHFVCQSCGYATAKWLGKCPECGQWDSFMIPKGNVERVGVRHIVDKKILTKVESVLKDRPENIMKTITWNRRFNMYLDKMKSGDIFEVADVVRTLAVQEDTKKLSTGERRLLNTAKQILLSEVMLVRSCDGPNSEAWLMKFFG